MRTALEFFLLAAALAILAPALLLLLQVLAALWPQRPARLPAGARPRLAVLVPAHDEAGGLAATIAGIQAQLAPGDRLLVVADNCSDTTAAIARAHGAQVIERRDPGRRGKGYALDCGIRHLAADPPAVVVIVDADCALGPDSLEWLGKCCAASGRPVQAADLMRAPPGAGLGLQLAEFAWLLKNGVRPLGYRRLGLPCQLMGTGMALPWPLLAAAPAAGGHLVEDLKLGLDLARGGHPPLFCPPARVTSRFPPDAAGARQQRRRWEHGHLGMICGEAPRLILTAAAAGNLPLLALALDLCIPPLALLALGAGLLLAANLALGAAGLAPALAATLCLVLAVVLAWAGYGREIVSLRGLAFAPLYALAKIPLYLGFLAGRQRDWVRSRRHED